MPSVFFFFFQAEDGIRDYKVTGVQTCALPIWCEHVGKLCGIDREGAVAAVISGPALTSSDRAAGVRFSPERSACGTCGSPRGCRSTILPAPSNRENPPAGSNGDNPALLRHDRSPETIRMPRSFHSPA